MYLQRGINYDLTVQRKEEPTLTHMGKVRVIIRADHNQR
jgi:hypothetical protein